MSPLGRSVIAALAAVIGALIVSDAAALEVRVRGESELEARVEGAGTILQVSGRLKDELGRGLAQRELAVRISERDSDGALVDRDVLTGPRGEFAVKEELPPGDYVASVSFRGTEHFDARDVRDSVHLEPQPLEIRAYGPPYVLGREKPAVVYARAYAGRTGVQMASKVLVNGEEVDRLMLDASGRGTIDVADYLSEGENTVEIVVPGSVYREESRARARIRFSDAVEMTAALETRLERLARGVAIHGRVEDSTGPVVGARVRTVLEAVEVPEGEESPSPITVATLTDGDGRYSGFVDTSRLGNGVFVGTARLVPAAGTSVEAETGEVELDDTAFRWTLNGLALVALAAGLVMLFNRGLRSIYDAIARFRKRRRRARMEKIAFEEEEEIVPVSLADEAGPVVVEGETAETNSDIGGLVWDEWQGSPVPHARLVLEPKSGSAPHEAHSSDGGRFLFRELPPGEFRLTVSAEGFMRGTLDVKIPHDGRLRNFRLDLVAVPLKIRRLYQMVVETTAGEDFWGLHTPREIENELAAAMSENEHHWENEDARRHFHARVLRAVRAADDDFGPEELFAAMTEIVEESYYSGRVYDENAFRLARSVALRLKERAAERKLS